ncbi:hypothetical protein EON63_15830 [archaeon]|nr:MAG: hypothetical protein EON63_15830 [archaeon]
MKAMKDILVYNTSRRGNDDILIDKFNIDFNYAKFICLRPRTWLNDEAINFYMLMLQERDDLLCKYYIQPSTPTPSHTHTNTQRRGSHYFNSFFLTKLLENNTYTYSQVRRWTKKFDLFSKDKVFIPVNISNTHWTLCVVYVQKREIRLVCVCVHIYGLYGHGYIQSYIIDMFAYDCFYVACMVYLFV